MGKIEGEDDKEESTKKRSRLKEGSKEEDVRERGDWTGIVG